MMSYIFLNASSDGGILVYRPLYVLAMRNVSLNFLCVFSLNNKILCTSLCIIVFVANHKRLLQKLCLKKSDIHNLIHVISMKNLIQRVTDRI